MSHSEDSRVENHFADLRERINNRRNNGHALLVASPSSATSVYSPGRHQTRSRTRSRSPPIAGGRRSRSRSPTRSFRNPSRSRSRSPRYSRTTSERDRDHVRRSDRVRRGDHVRRDESRYGHPTSSTPLSFPGIEEVPAFENNQEAAEVTDPKGPSFIPHELTKEIVKWGVVSVNPEESKAIREAFKLNFERPSTTLSPPAIDGWLARQFTEVGKEARQAMEVTEKAWLTAQFKVLDIASPLIYLLDELHRSPPLPYDQIIPIIRASLIQWGRAFSHISDKRRANLLSTIVPGATHLLDDPKAHAWRQRRAELFGQQFYGAILESRRQDETMAALRPKKPTYNTRSRGGHSGRGGARNGGGGNVRKQHSSYKPKGYVPFPSLHDYVPPPSLIGGRLRFYLPAWSSFTDDTWVLEGLANGFSLEFETHPPPSGIPGPVQMSREMQAVCDKEVEDLLAKGAIIEILDGSSGFVSSFFCVPKKGKGFRPIVNLKRLNSYLAFEHFKMEGLVTVRGLLRKGDWMVKVDLKDAYLTVPIDPAHHPYLRFSWRGKIFQFLCLPFGLTSAPRWFTKLLKVVAAFLRGRGIRFVIYLDDILLIGDSRDSLLDALALLIRTLEFLGFIINWDKSVLTPSHTLEYLGVIWDTEWLSCSLPLDKIISVESKCSDLLSHARVRLSSIASILGSFVWTTAAVPFAQAHCRSLQNLFIWESRRNNNDLTAFCTLCPEARKELAWWTTELRKANGKGFTQMEPDLVIFSDASLSGWGASCSDVTARGPWTAGERSRHINELELWAAFYALRSFCCSSSNISVRIFIDNTTAVSYVNRSGGTRSRSLSRVAEAIAFWCERRSIAIEAFYIPGRLNTVADAESRAKEDASDWQLCPLVFAGIARIWPVNIDLFASGWNRQLIPFCSWRPQPDAHAVNAFSLNWSEWRGYAFPPFSLILTCLNKARREQVEIVFITPVWPSQPWFPVLLEMVVDIPRIIKPHSALLQSSRGDPHPLLKQGVLLAAWKLSGSPSQSKAFRNKLSTLSRPVSAHLRRLHTRPPGTLGCIGVCDGISIPCLSI